VGKTRRDRIINTYIMRELKMEEIQNQIEESRLRWFGQVRRMDEHGILKRLLEKNMSGRRPRSRPRMQWVDQRRGRDLRMVHERQERADRDSVGLYAKVNPQVWKQHKEVEYDNQNIL
jgi:hypothetical protein